MEGWVDPRMIAGMQAGQIDPIKYHSLRYLMLFCWELSKHEATTKMGVSNLALVIAPNVLKVRTVTATPCLLPATVVTDWHVIYIYLTPLFSPACVDFCHARFRFLRRTSLAIPWCSRATQRRRRVLSRC